MLQALSSSQLAHRFLPGVPGTRSSRVYLFVCAFESRVVLAENSITHRLCFDSSGRATPACTVVPPSPSVAVARSFTRVEHAHASRAVFRRAWSAPAPRGPVRHETHDDKMSTLAAIAAPFAGEAVAARRRAPSRARATRSARCAASEEVRSQPSIPSRLSPPPGPPPRAPHPADHVILTHVRARADDRHLLANAQSNVQTA